MSLDNMYECPNCGGKFDVLKNTVRGVDKYDCEVPMVDQAMLDFVRDFIESHDPVATKLTRRFPFRRLADHCFRCYRWADRISRVEGGDADIAQVSALFHDIGKCVDNTRQGHAAAGAEVCSSFLTRIGYEPSKRNRIVSIVRHHIEHCRGDEYTLEARIESDADILDETGALTVLWDCMAQGAEQEQSYGIARDRIRGAYCAMQETPRSALHTETGWRFFQERREFLATFIENLDFELGIALELSDGESNRPC